MKLHNWKAWLRPFSIAVLVVLVVAGAVHMRSRPAQNTDVGLPVASDSTVQSAPVSSQPDNGQPGSSQSDGPQGQWQSLDVGQGDQSGSEMATSTKDTAANSDSITEDAAGTNQDRKTRQLILTQYTSQVNELLGQTPPLEGKELRTEIQARLDRAKEVEDIYLEGLPYAARCTILMRNAMGTGGCCFGLVDLNLDGVPEFFQEPHLPGDVYVYDLSGVSVQELLVMNTGSAMGKQTPFDLDIEWEIEDRWRVYATVFPNGSPGGIIETSWGKHYTFAYFFTTDVSQFPVEFPLVLEQEYSGVADVEEWYQIFLDANLYERHGLENMGWPKDETYEGLDDDGFSVCWYTERMTEDELIDSIEGTPLDVVRTLPRNRWSTPLVRTEYFFNEELSLADLLQLAQDLYTEYNTRLATGDY